MKGSSQTHKAAKLACLSVDWHLLNQRHRLHVTYLPGSFQLIAAALSHMCMYVHKPG